jgi:hypothetical protein
MCRYFEKWTSEGYENDFWMGTPRFQACVMVDKDHLDSVLSEGPPAEEFGVDCEGNVTLVSRDKEEDMTFVGLSYLVPRIYSLSEISWKNFAKEPDEGECAGPVLDQVTAQSA